MHTLGLYGFHSRAMWLNQQLSPLPVPGHLRLTHENHPHHPSLSTSTRPNHRHRFRQSQVRVQNPRTYSRWTRLHHLILMTTTPYLVWPMIHIRILTAHLEIIWRMSHNPWLLGRDHGEIWTIYCFDRCLDEYGYHSTFRACNYISNYYP
jgi:hypothetical protein